MKSLKQFNFKYSPRNRGATLVELLVYTAILPALFLGKTMRGRKFHSFFLLLWSLVVLAGCKGVVSNVVRDKSKIPSHETSQNEDPPSNPVVSPSPTSPSPDPSPNPSPIVSPSPSPTPTSSPSPSVSPSPSPSVIPSPSPSPSPSEVPSPPPSVTPSPSPSPSPSPIPSATPTIQLFNPSFGFTSGGTILSIRGTNFSEDATVWIGATQCLNPIITNSVFVGSNISCLTSSHASGTVPVTVINPNGSSATSFFQFTYLAPTSLQLFNPSKGFNGDVNEITPLNDGTGRIYVGGKFTFYNGTTANGIVRLNSNGSLDATFNTGSGFNIGFNYYGIKSITPLNDGTGRIYVGGEFTSYNGVRVNRIIRLYSNGTIDASFNIDLGFNNVVNVIAPLNDGTGRFYVGGIFTSYNSAIVKGIARLHPNGSLDSSFDSGSGFTAPYLGAGSVYDIAFMNDGTGRIYVGGYFTGYNGQTASRITRLNADGTCDTSFTSNFNGDVNSIISLNDGSGRIYVGGGFTSHNSTTLNRLVRLYSNGIIDTSFSIGSGFDSAVHTITPLNDGTGRIYVGGQFTYYRGTSSSAKGMIRLNPDGIRDASLDVGIGFSYGATVSSILPLNDGTERIFVGGKFTSYNGTIVNRLVRLDANGSLNEYLGVGSGFVGRVFSLLPLNDGTGRIYVGGEYLESYNGTEVGTITRLNPNGTLDTSFNLYPSWWFLWGAEDVYSMAPLNDGTGSIYVGGQLMVGGDSYSARQGIIRLYSNGTVDTTFNSRFVSSSNHTGRIFAITPLNDGTGKIYVGGYFDSCNGATVNRIARLNSDGSLDTSFNIGSGFSSSVSSILLLNDGTGRIYVGGHFTSYNGTTVNSIIRLNADGSLDTSFNIGSGFNYFVKTMLPLEDGTGRIYVGGYFTSYNGTPVNKIARLNPNGTLDTSFSIGSGFSHSNSPQVYSIAPLTDGSGRIYVGGNFTSYNGATANFIVRLNTDGSMDPSFNIGLGFNNGVTTITPSIDGTGRIYVGGNFTSYQSNPADRIIRLLPTGAWE